MRQIVGIAVGAVVGFLLYRFIGCSTGSCPITANPVTSSLYGALLGFLVTL
ncbi:DUF6132 family protein [Chitinivibrio alkaliphilus]|uniref:YtxH domain-containing protein n=1 Tax=Chitinivibrio alkaliphilus ACht1 TaxID=1313304 RepID=U7D8C7_9BACT|nr:DUF6132 family protein [Chitinivibrio alkaliphilus]ERP32203.1 hypothetical protein CALK_0934 [Chitinivibrio alkaliphilus ACht1]